LTFSSFHPEGWIWPAICYGAGIQEQFVTPSTRAFHRLAIIGALIAALGISACGRKGMLDPPPAAVVETDPAPVAVVTMPDLISPARTSRPPTPRGPDKRLPIDFLLD
jgi:predicted small lipoprotein YifL